MITSVLSTISHFALSALQNFMGPRNPGRCPGLLHFAPSALKPRSFDQRWAIFTQSASRTGARDTFRAKPTLAVIFMAASKISKLTKREREIIALVAEGLKNKEIAGRLPDRQRRRKKRFFEMPGGKLKFMSV